MLLIAVNQIPILDQALADGHFLVVRDRFISLAVKNLLLVTV